jgi:Meckel syndrome type 1 protein
VAAAAANQLDYRLDIINASRSVMMFTVNYQLTIANRSAHAVRDLSIAAQLICARQGKALTQPNRTPEQIDRIGPHQSRSVSGQMQLPLSDVLPLRQGNKPLLVPLAKIEIARPGAEPVLLDFVIGTPSAAASGRLHPIPLDTPPGGVPSPMAQQVKQ